MSCLWIKYAYASRVRYGVCMEPKKQQKKYKQDRSGTYSVIRISKKAHKALAEKAKREKRTIIATVEEWLGV